MELLEGGVSARLAEGAVTSTSASSAAAVRLGRLLPLGQVSLFEPEVCDFPMFLLPLGQGEGLGEAFDLSGRGGTRVSWRKRTAVLLRSPKPDPCSWRKRTAVLLRPPKTYPPIRGQRNQGEP